MNNTRPRCSMHNGIIPIHPSPKRARSCASGTVQHSFIAATAPINWSVRDKLFRPKLIKQRIDSLVHQTR